MYRARVVQAHWPRDTRDPAVTRGDLEEREHCLDEFAEEVGEVVAEEGREWFLGADRLIFSGRRNSVT